MSFAAAERRRLADTLSDLGPDAPTLCEGWRADDLAVHLYIREHRPDAAAGMVVGGLRRHLSSVTQEAKGLGFDEVVNRWVAGPPRWNPMRYADRWVNTAEHFVHLEDLRRGDGEVRERDFSQTVDDEFWQILERLAPALLRRSRRPVILTSPGRRPVVCARGRGVAASGNDVVRVSGNPGELLLWVFGRDAAAVVIAGDRRHLHRSSM